MRKIFFLIGLLVYLSNCKSQNKTNELHFPRVGWTMSFPPGSNILTASQIDSIQNETSKKTDAYSRLEKNEVLFAIRKGESNFFAASLTAFDSSMFDTGEKTYDYTKTTVIRAVASNSTIQIIDTTSSIETIDGVPFQVFFVKTYYPQKSLTRDTYWFYRKQEGFDFSINISYTDTFVGNEYLNVLRTSTFKK